MLGATAQVRVMADFEPSALPAWARVGRRVEALDPNGDPSRWFDAAVEEAVRGVSGAHDDGLRLWVRYERSGLCQWLRRHEVCARPVPSRRPFASPLASLLAPPCVAPCTPLRRPLHPPASPLAPPLAPPLMREEP